jgi:lipopolysaccharide/colanic/teichoic acid biosynthesis glycosyltransferase
MGKRLFDVVCAACLLIVTAPLLIAVALGVRLSSPGPSLYRARRVGRGGKPFTMFKFRTMRLADSGDWNAVTANKDHRVFWLGALLRASKIDELPQLFNVLRGEMSIVGPRPEDPKFVDRHFTPEHWETLRVAPGLASPGSIYHYTHGAQMIDDSDPERHYVERVLPLKMALELVYVRRASLLYDLAIMGRTLRVLAARALGKRTFRPPPEMRQAEIVTGERRATICLLSAVHPPRDKRVFQKEGISLARAGFRVVHLCPGTEPGHETAEGVELVTYRHRPGKLFRLLMLPVLFWKARAIDADAYHCNEPDSWLVGVALRLLCGRIVVFDCHEHYPGQVVRWLPWSLRTIGAWATRYYLQVLGLLTDRIVLAKYSVADDFSWSRSRHTVVLNTTPLAAIQDTDRAGAPRSTREEPATFTFVHIGVIRRERGSEELLLAMRILARRGVKSFRVLIIGEFKDGSEQAFFDKARVFGLYDQIEFHRWMPFAEAFALVRQSHAGLILFQKTLANNVRGMPHKMFDYMLAGLPVIAPDFAPDIVGVLDKAGAGLLIDTGEPEALADAMQALIEDGCLARQLGERGRQAVLEKYHWERDAQTLIAAYHELLGTTADLSACHLVKNAA